MKPVKCHDKLSGEIFEIDGIDREAEIRKYIWLGIDQDSGVVEYDVVTEDGELYRGEVDPTEDEDYEEEE